MTVKPYGREHALALLEPSSIAGEWAVDERGLWPPEINEHLWRWGMHAEYEVVAWKPASVLADASDAPDLTKTPALPFPFDGRDLAAFMLAGYGCMVADFYGEWTSGPDAHQLSRIDPGNNFAKRAVKEAFDAYRSAVGRVGGRDLELNRRACESCAAYTAARSEALLRHCVSEVPQQQPGDSDTRRMELDAEYTRRIALVNADLAEQEAEMNRLQAEDKAAEQKWLHAMVAELLKPDTGPAEQGSSLVATGVQMDATSSAGSAAAASATERIAALRRLALIHKHRPRWPTIEDDLKEASRNGLKSAASVAHGMWSESKALAWAESRGKLKDGGNFTGMPSPWAGAVRVHTMED